MNQHPNDSDHKQHLLDGYNRMLHRAKERLEQAEKGVMPQLKDLLEATKKTAVEIGELTKDEAERISIYLKRDLHEAAQSMRESRKELGEWLRFDVDLIEDRMLEAFSRVVDHTRIELAQWNHPPQAEAEEDTHVLWHTGEVTGLGTLMCTECGKEMHFKKVGHIPPCPGCRGTEFSRVPDED